MGLATHQGTRDKWATNYAITLTGKHPWNPSSVAKLAVTPRPQTLHNHTSVKRIAVASCP